MTEQTRPSRGRRGTAGALLWRQEGWERAPLLMGGQSVAAQRRRIETCAIEMGMAIVNDFGGNIGWPNEAAHLLNTLTWLLDRHPVDCLIMTRACMRRLDDDALIAFTVRLMNRGIDLVLAD